MKKADDSLLDNGQNYQQHQGQTPCAASARSAAWFCRARRLQNTPNQHEFGQQQSLDDCDAPRGKFYAFRVQHGGLHHDDRAGVM
jgi:hypothetical protein